VSEKVQAYFLSDLHLESETDSNFFVLKDFLSQRILKKDISHLFLLGDIFDLWVSDHHYFRDRFSATIGLFKELRHHGVEIHYFEGNHDLDLQPFFEKEGFVIHAQASEMVLGRKKWLMEHGDQMDPEDRGYLFLRWLLRTPVMRWLERSLPGLVVQWIGDSLSSTSRRYTTHLREGLGSFESERREKIFRKILKHVEKLLRRGRSFDFHISGHVHEQFHEVFRIQNQSVELINLGSWLGPQKWIGFYSEERGFCFEDWKSSAP